MKLAAIYNVFDGEELLEGSIKTIIDHVDEIIIVWQDVSNWGEKRMPQFTDFVSLNPKIVFIYYQPGDDPRKNEIKKRNLGLDKACTMKCTHFLHLDCDEYYKNFGDGKEIFIRSGHKGSVVPLHTYFKKPTLRLATPENYFVPFIHELRKDTIAGASSYPFYVDPTRRINERDVIEIPVHMHHYSFIRKDISRKIRNSTAKKSLERSCVINDYKNAVDGYYCKYYERNLIKVPNYFNIPEWD
jgi:hypothetical protein